jgi:hypothetical protein
LPFVAYNARPVKALSKAMHSTILEFSYGIGLDPVKDADRHEINFDRRDDMDE